MSLIAAAFLYAIALWWLTTGIVLRLCRVEGPARSGILLAVTFVGIGALLAIVRLSAELTVANSFLAFTAAVLLWGWHETSYYMGALTGPRPRACPAGARGWQRFRLAVAVSLWHELAIVGTAALLALLTWQAPNQAGLWTFAVLWWMRWSAKLNLFLGVPNLHEEFLPARLRYLATYMRQRPMNGLFPVSVTLGSAGVVLILTAALAGGAPPAVVAGAVLVATLLALAVLEHWFLVLPLNDAALWSWGFGPDRPSRHGSPEAVDGDLKRPAGEPARGA